MTGTEPSVYPAELARTVPWRGETLHLRPIRPDDADRHRRFLEQLDPADIRLRIFYSRRTIEPAELARLTTIDYDREMAFVATRDGPDGEETLGVVRAVTEADNGDAEFGVIVRSDLKGSGLGRLLMERMVEHLRSRGTQRLVATLLHGNDRMLALARSMGFTLDPVQDDPAVYRIEMPLAAGGG